MAICSMGSDTRRTNLSATEERLTHASTMRTNSNCSTSDAPLRHRSNAAQMASSSMTAKVCASPVVKVPS